MGFFGTSYIFCLGWQASLEREELGVRFFFFSLQMIVSCTSIFDEAEMSNDYGL